MHFSGQLSSNNKSELVCACVNIVSPSFLTKCMQA